MTNEGFLDRVLDILKERDMTLYQLQKLTNEDEIKESTFYSMFEKKSVARIEYICEISRALGMSSAEMIDEESNQKYLKPIQIEILNEFDGLDEAMIQRILPIVKGVILAEKSKE